MQIDLPAGTIEQGDSLEVLRRRPENSVDLVFGSGPYGKQRRYAGEPGVTAMAGEAWVSWMAEVFAESCRVSRGLVAYVVNGSTKEFSNDMTPFLLAADLKRSQSCPACGRRICPGLGAVGDFCSYPSCKALTTSGAPTFRVRKPPLFCRWGTCGSGSVDWFRDNYELIICATRWDVKRLPYGTPVNIGKSPKYASGGPATSRGKDDRRTKAKKYAKPKIANPGNVLWHNVGKGHMGSDLSGENEAPFPQTLARDFILMFCPPGGIVLDPFVGSGTTPAAAVETGRRFYCSDVRESQVELASRRVRATIEEMKAQAAERSTFAGARMEVERSRKDGESDG